MAYEANERYYIKECELMLLLAGAGVSGFYGIVSDVHKKSDSTAPEQEEIYRILAGLYQKSYVEWEEKAVRILEPVNTMICILKDSKHCMIIKFDTDFEQKCCYFSHDKVVMFEKVHQEKEMLRFSLWDENDFLSYLWEMELFPNEEMEQQEKESLMLPEIAKGEFILFDNQTGKEKERVSIVEEGVFSYILYNDKKQLYMKEQCETLLTTWFHMEA